jgi:hypothetical protein
VTTAPTPSRADALIREHRASMHAETLRAWASDAVDELRRLQADNERLRADQAQAMHEASSLAMSLFRKHYSSDPDYASGAVKFGLCDDLRGVISQIDNMSTGLARAELEARKPLPLSDEQIEGLREQTFSTNNPFCPCDSKTMRKAVRAAERAHGIKEP